MFQKAILLLALCSLAWSEKSSRIIGGNEADIDDFPYQIQVHRANTGLIDCGAAIISEYWAISTASCISFNVNPSKYVIRAGTSTYNVAGDLHGVDKFFLHPNFHANYDGPIYDYDVALIKVKKPFDIHSSKPIKPIHLAEIDNDPIENTIVTASGWGSRDISSNPGRQLRSVNIPVVDRLTCEINYGNDKITTRMLCAGASYSGPCWNDDATPLVQNNVLVGLTSWGDYCEKYSPMLFTRIGHPEIRRWINYVAGV